MSNRARKILDEWKRHIPQDASKEDVEKVVDAFLGGCVRRLSKGGSHRLVVEHAAFKQLGLFDGYGQFTIKMDKKKVTHCYLKDIVKAIEALEIVARVDKELK